MDSEEAGCKKLVWMMPEKAYRLPHAAGQVLPGAKQAGQAATVLGMSARGRMGLSRRICQKMQRSASSRWSHSVEKRVAPEIRGRAAARQGHPGRCPCQ